MIKQQLKSCIFLGLGALLFSCATKMEPGANKVKLIKADPDPKCEDLGDVRGSSAMGDMNGVKNEMKNRAYKMGANVVRLETSTANAKNPADIAMSGTAFKCP